MNERAELLMSLLGARYGVPMDEGAARDVISERVDRVAELMRIGRQAAKFYVTDDVISQMADKIGHEVAQRSPRLRIVR